ncbi:MAG: hypothetical protein AAF487_12095 [Bacteroidota bacterium]
MNKIIFLLSLLLSFSCLAQSPEEKAPLPDIFAHLENELKISHFPSPVFASIDPDEPDTYIWKHNTCLISFTKDIKVLEGGAYIFYNDQWNLRVRMEANEFCKLFDIKKCELKAGQPYTFADNWRRDQKLYGGWAMWYAIGVDKDGKKVFGVGKLDTVGELYLNKESQ